MEYYAPDWWYEPDVEPETPADHGWVHEDDLPDLEHCTAMLQSVINSVYETGDVELLEDCLDELASQLNCKMPGNNIKPLLGKKGSVRTDRMLDSWVQLNHEYNESLRKQATC